VKNVMIRGVFAALSLTIGVVQMAQAAAYGTPNQPAAAQPASGRITNALANRIYAGESTMAIRAGDISPPASTHKSAVQSGNGLNWLGGGGG
jgi:hypothetical protein